MEREGETGRWSKTTTTKHKKNRLILSEGKNTPQKTTNSTANKVHMITECGVTQREREKERERERERERSRTKCRVIKKTAWGHTKRARSHTKHTVMKRQSMKLHRAWSHTQQRQEYGTIQRARNHADTRQGYAEHGITLIQDRVTQSAESR